jgi:hypothetical protein
MELALMPTLTLGQMVALIGAPQRAVLHWTASGALVSLTGSHPGQGRQRAFAPSEAVVGCIVHAFTLDSLPIGKLIHLTRAVRAVLQDETNRDLISQAISDETKVYLYYDQTMRPTFIHSEFGKAQFFADMDASNIKSNVVYLNGAFAQLRANNFTLKE